MQLSAENQARVQTRDSSSTMRHSRHVGIAQRHRPGIATQCVPAAGGSSQLGKRPRGASAANLLRGQHGRAVPGDTIVAAERTVKLQPFDQALRRFRWACADALLCRAARPAGLHTVLLSWQGQARAWHGRTPACCCRHREALDAALQTNDTPVIVSLLEELAARGALNAAIGASQRCGFAGKVCTRPCLCLSRVSAGAACGLLCTGMTREAVAGGRDAASLLPLLAHLRKNVCHPRHARLLTDIAHRVLDIYAVTVRAHAGARAGSAALTAAWQEADMRAARRWACPQRWTRRCRGCRAGWPTRSGASSGWPCCRAAWSPCWRPTWSRERQSEGAVQELSTD